MSAMNCFDVLKISLKDLQFETNQRAIKVMIYYIQKNVDETFKALDFEQKYET